MWDKDDANTKNNFFPYDMIDEFSFDYFEPLGAGKKVVKQLGVRREPKSM